MLYFNFLKIRFNNGLIYFHLIKNKNKNNNNIYNNI